MTLAYAPALRTKCSVVVHPAHSEGACSLSTTYNKMNKTSLRKVHISTDWSSTKWPFLRSSARVVQCPGKAVAGVRAQRTAGEATCCQGRVHSSRSLFCPDPSCCMLLTACKPSLYAGFSATEFKAFCSQAWSTQ